ncbi:MAG: vancomycin resistance protein [Anaerolineales bacterium]|nr:MAG: vancomycin resistance protein [Anaerolineales bacterium]
MPIKDTFTTMVSKLPIEIETLIRQKLADLEQPGRLALSTRYPVLAGGILYVKQSVRTISNVLNTRLTRTVRPTFYENVISRHQSVLFRRLGGSDPRLQMQKVTNLKMAVRKLNGLVIDPGKAFSFWHVVGRPTYQDGYVDGMLLSNGKVIEGIGGGLCQLSNLIYWLFLHTPLTITEQHRHTLDVFPDSGRVLPFGSGATIMYNTIDLQAQNETESAMQLKLWVTEKHLKGQVLAPEPVPVKYHIIEKHHSFVIYKGRYYRFNEIWREETLEGETVRIEKITTNFSPVMYDVDKNYLEKNNFQVWVID